MRKKIESILLSIMAIVTIMVLATGGLLIIHVLVTWFMEALTFLFKTGCMIFAVGLMSYVVYEIILLLIDDD